MFLLYVVYIRFERLKVNINTKLHFEISDKKKRVIKI